MRRRNGENSAGRPSPGASAACFLSSQLLLFQAFFQKQEPEGGGGSLEPRGPGWAHFTWSHGEPGPVQSPAPQQQALQTTGEEGVRLILC